VEAQLVFQRGLRETFSPLKVSETSRVGSVVPCLAGGARLGNAVDDGENKRGKLSPAE
jgi:hypothetical protein